MSWFLIAIALPCLAPLFPALLFRLLPVPPTTLSRFHPLLPFKDGQLCWAGIGFCSAALHEQATVLAEPPGWLTGVLIVTLVLASMLAALGAMFRTALGRPRGTRWLVHYRCFASSLVITGMAAMLYLIIHFDIA